MGKEEIVVFEGKSDDEEDEMHRMESRRARSWDGVVSGNLEEGNPTGLRTLESLNNRTTVRIKWLGSASH